MPWGPPRVLTFAYSWVCLWSKPWVPWTNIMRDHTVKDWLMIHTSKGEELKLPGHSSFWHFLNFERFALQAWSCSCTVIPWYHIVPAVQYHVTPLPNGFGGLGGQFPVGREISDTDSGYFLSVPFLSALYPPDLQQRWCKQPAGNPLCPESQPKHWCPVPRKQFGPQNWLQLERRRQTANSQAVCNSSPNRTCLAKPTTAQMSAKTVHCVNAKHSM